MNWSSFQLTITILQILGPLVALFALVASWIIQREYSRVVIVTYKIILTLFGFSILLMSSVGFWYNVRIENIGVFGLANGLPYILGSVIVFLALGAIMIIWLVLFRF